MTRQSRHRPRPKPLRSVWALTAAVLVVWISVVVDAFCPAVPQAPFSVDAVGGRTIIRPSRRTPTELQASSIRDDDDLKQGTTAVILPAIAVAVQDAFRRLDDLYASSSSIRCPFFRRRAADAVDSMALVLRFLLIRHKSLGILDPLWDLDDGLVDGMVGSDALRPPGCKPLSSSSPSLSSDGADTTTAAADGKVRNLPLSSIASAIESDWIRGPEGKRGYYITGRLTSSLYRDDCLFDGPDPDMPVRGLRKYLSAASHLFDAKDSHAELLSLEYQEGGGRRGRGSVTTTWRLDGTLMLPWRPRVRPWTGRTTYHVDEEGLIYHHEEEWDISVWEAFVCTVWPEVGERIWGKEETQEE